MRFARIGVGSCGLAAGAGAVRDALDAALPTLGVEVVASPVGCVGLCHREPVLELSCPEFGTALYGDVTPERVPQLLAAHFIHGEPPADLLIQGDTPAPFLAAQERVVLRRCGHVDPSSLADYESTGGYSGLRRALVQSCPENFVADVIAAGLRGRGGGGFPTGRKWALARASDDPQKVLICNADEGDPGAFMDRNIIEGDPFAVIEGMTLAAWAIGASEGFVYVRDEYPLAVRRLEHAVAVARAAGLLGERILDSDFDFDIRLRRGAGAFVCGEETALIASLEGRRGIPTRRPPYPVQRGLDGHPTCINNVETLANVAAIAEQGPEAFAARGTEGSRGTKVFSLAGDVKHTGMVEVPMGITLRDLVDRIGGGSKSGHPVKAVQTGGPSGGCIPAAQFDTPVDYESLQAIGAIMGSGGLVVLDAGACMVDIARYFLAFTQDESCGKCTFCRVGTKRMLEILERICGGRGRKGDLELLERLAAQVTANSLCGLGKSAPNPVLTTLRWFRDEYEAHIDRGCCPAGKCKELVTFRIDPLRCDGCTMCADQCVADAIRTQGGVIHLEILDDPCTRCGGCFSVCRFGAVAVR